MGRVSGRFQLNGLPPIPLRSKPAGEADNFAACVTRWIRSNRLVTDIGTRILVTFPVEALASSFLFTAVRTSVLLPLLSGWTGMLCNRRDGEVSNRQPSNSRLSSDSGLLHQVETICRSNIWLIKGGGGLLKQELFAELCVDGSLVVVVCFKSKLGRFLGPREKRYLLSTPSNCACVPVTQKREGGG